MSNVLATLREVLAQIEEIIEKYKRAEFSRDEASANLTALEKQFKEQSNDAIPLMGADAILDQAEKEMAADANGGYVEEDEDSSSSEG